MTGAENSLYAEEVESCLLGLLLLYSETWGQIIGEVRADDFGNPLHSRVFEEIDKEYRKGQTLNPITVSATLEAVEDSSRSLARACTLPISFRLWSAGTAR